MQENGEFTLLVGKKEEGGKTGGVRVIRSMGFYTASAAPKEMRINDFIPVEPPEPADLPQNRKAAETLLKSLVDGSFNEMVTRCLKPDPTLSAFHRLFDRNYANPQRPVMDRKDAAFGVLGWFLGGMKEQGAQAGDTSTQTASPAAATSQVPAQATAPVTPDQTAEGTTPAAPPVTIIPGDANIKQALSAVCAKVMSTPKEAISAYSSAVPVADDDPDSEIRIDTGSVTNLIQVTNQEADAFRDKAMPILRSVLLMLDDVGANSDEDSIYDEMGIADRDTLLDAEMAARGEPFTSLEEKFETEDRITDMHRSIGDATQYPAPPTPQPRSVSDLKLTVRALNERCKQEVKGSLKEEI
jgi:intracellular multiplication protein IcmO